MEGANQRLSRKCNFMPRAAFRFETLLTDRDSRCLSIATERLLVTSHVDAVVRPLLLPRKRRRMMMKREKHLAWLFKTIDLSDKIQEPFLTDEFNLETCSSNDQFISIQMKFVFFKFGHDLCICR